jgi:hypothetical protein
MRFSTVATISLASHLAAAAPQLAGMDMGALGAIVGSMGKGVLATTVRGLNCK